MIQFTKGNLLQTNTQALVNTVNTVGIMGKGIALLFKEKFPENFKLYAAAVKNNLVHTGKMFVTTLNRTDDIKYIINFPTKTEWYKPSSYQYIEEGLQDLVEIKIKVREAQLKL